MRTQLVAGSTLSPLVRPIQDQGGQLYNVLAYGVSAVTGSDQHDALQYVLDTASANGGGLVLFPPGSVRIDAPLRLRPSVSLAGRGMMASGIDYRGTGTTGGAAGLKAAFYCDEDLGTVVYQDFYISHANNPAVSSDIAFMLFKAGLSWSWIVRVLGICKNGVTGDGIVIHGVNPDTATPNNNAYGTTLEPYMQPDTAPAPGVGVKLYGEDVLNGRCNRHYFRSGVVDGFATGLFVNGNGNEFGTIGVNGGGSGATVAAIHLYGSATYGNVFTCPYLDSGVTGDWFRVELTAANLNAGTVISCPLDIPDNKVNYVGANAATSVLTYPRRGQVMAPKARGGPQFNPASSTGAFFMGPLGCGYQGYFASPLAGGGGFVASEETFAGGVNVVSNAGGATALIGTGGEYRLVKSGNGTSATKLLVVDASGNATWLTGTVTITLGDLVISAGKLTLPGGVSLTAAAAIPSATQYQPNLKGWTGDTQSPQTATVLPAAATVFLCKIPLLGPATFSNIQLFLAAVAGSSLTHCFVAAYDSSGNVLGQSTDQSSVWGSGGTPGLKVLALTNAPITVTPGAYPAFVWAAIYVGTAAGTLPQFQRAAQSALLNAGCPVASSRYGSVAVADTASLPNITPSGITQTTNGWWLAIS